MQKTLRVSRLTTRFTISYVSGAQTLGLVKPVKGKQLQISELGSGSWGGECLQPFSWDPSSAANETAGINQCLFIYKPSTPRRRRKKKKTNPHAGNPAFVFVRKADKMSCHPFSQQETVRTAQMKALTGLAAGARWCDSEHTVHSQRTSSHRNKTLFNIRYLYND